LGHSSGYISAPVSFADVNAALGTRHTDLGNLCKDDNIEKWAKYKPFRKNLVGLPSEADRRNARFGLNPAILASGNLFNKIAWDCVCGVVKSANNLGGLWEYLKPRGSTYNEHYRLHDFVDVTNQTNGYKQDTSIPISVSVFATNIIHNGDIYELNTSTSPILDVVLSAGGGANNIALWEFLQTAYNTSGANWRLRVGVFVDNGFTPWYERSQELNISRVSDVITFSGATSAVTVGTSIDFSGLTVNTGTIYYVVVGIQRCDASGNASVDYLDSGFGILPPWTDEQAADGNWPFLFKIKLVSYFDRKIKFGFDNQTIGWGTSSWFTYSASVFNGSYTSGQMWLTCQVERNANTLYFVKSTSTRSGNKINFGASSDNGQTIVELTPMQSRNPWTEAPANGVEIPSTSSSEQYTTLYMAGSVLPAYEQGKYFTLYIYTRQYTDNPQTKNWVISTTLTLHYT
jgi:hypothetical protein